MSLVKCPECEKIISNKALKCPFCGCPAEFFNNIESGKEALKESGKVMEKEQATNILLSPDLLSEDEITFCFGNREFTYPEDPSEFAAGIGGYLMLGEMIVYIADKMYDELGDIESVLRILPDILDSLIQKRILSFVVEILYCMGNSLSIQQFISKYGDRYAIQLEPYYTSIVEQYAKICHEEACLAEYRNQVKNSRGRWTGGGFGVKGAIKGAVTASLLNCGTDFLHSFGDSAREKRDNQEIQKKLKNLYKNPHTKQQLVGGIRICVLNILEALQDEMLENNIISTRLDIDYEKAMALYDNTRNWEKDQERYYDNIAQCIAYYPVNADFYREFDSEIKAYEENDISRFIEFWGFDKVLYMFDDDPKDQMSVLLQGWKLKQSLKMYYEKYKFYQHSDDIRREKEKASKYKNNRKKGDKDLADNIRRRFSIVIKSLPDSSSLIYLPLYVLQLSARPKLLQAADNIDQILLWDNGEVTITDYLLIIHDKVIELNEINEIWYESIDGESFFIQVMLKNHRSMDVEVCKKVNTIEILILFNIVLEPYREVEYITKFNKEVRDKYAILRNNKDIKALDNEEDKRRKIKIENWQKNNRKIEMEKYCLNNRKKEELEYSESIRRRFQKLLSLDGVNQEKIVNKYIYELEAENKPVPNFLRILECEPYEYLFYSDNVWAITDRRLYIVGRFQSSKYIAYRLEDINEVYIIGFIPQLIVSLKSGSQVSKKLGTDRQLIEIECEDIKSCRAEILFLLDIVLQPYIDVDFVSEIQDRDMLWDCSDEIIGKFEEEKGDFQEFIFREIDNESDRRKRKLIQSKADKRMEDRIRAADLYMKANANLGKDRFAKDFANIYVYLHENCYMGGNIKKEVKYFTQYRNRYDYEVYECMPKEIKKYLDDTPEKGQRILFYDKHLLLTDRNLYVNNERFSLYDIREVLVGETVECWEEYERDSDIPDWIDTKERLIIRQKNGKVHCMKDDTFTSFGFDKIRYSLNYTLKVLNHYNSGCMFLHDKSLFCEKCSSFEIIISDGIFGKKYRCANCNTKSKTKILILENDIEEESYRKAVSKFLLNYKMEFTNSTENSKLSKVICKNCGKEILNTVKFCNYCGQSINQNFINPKKVFCVFCGKEISQNVKFCNFCGKPHNVGGTKDDM